MIIPAVLLVVLLVSVAFWRFAPRLHHLSFRDTLQLSHDRDHVIIPIKTDGDESRRYRGMILVSNVHNSVAMSHRSPFANITVSETPKKFESFVIKVGKDTSEGVLESTYIRQAIEHGRAAVFRSEIKHSDDGSPFEAHDYYSRFLFSKARKIEQISMKLLKADDLASSPDIQFHINDIFLLE